MVQEDHWIWYKAHGALWNFLAQLVFQAQLRVQEMMEADVGMGTAGPVNGSHGRGEGGDGCGDETEDGERLREEAETIARRVAAKVFDDRTVDSVEHLAEGGYNHVWLATFRRGREDEATPLHFVLRIARDTPSLQPYQARNEVACLAWIKANVSSIPTPTVYDWDDGVSNGGKAFTAEEYVPGQRLSVVWPQLSEQQKTEICRQIANIIADLGETRFDRIGSLTPGCDHEPSYGPTVEAAKVFNGRTRYHSSQCYDIGSYANSKDYVLACYDREIYFYTHADREDIEDFFEGDTSVADFVDVLKQRRQELLDPKSEDIFGEIDAEPLVLVHEDFHASNMLLRDGKVVAVLDWEFSGVYPLSQLLGRAQIVQISMPLEDRTDETEKEEDDWHERYRGMVREVVGQRGWAEKDIETLFGGGHEVLNVARMIMFPS